MQHLSPIFKWTGGKRREIKHFEHLIPEFKQYVEPFIGGGALYFHLNCKNSVINDFDSDVANFYNMVKNNFPQLNERINTLKLLSGNHDAMQKQYYDFRDLDPKEMTDSIEKAVRFVYINQLAFSGIRRFNSSGKFNTPFGHYKNFSVDITDDHVALLKATTVFNGDAIVLIPKYDKKDTFMFLDPPYTRVFKEYSPDNNFGEDHQIALAKAANGLKQAKFMLVINDDEKIRELYKDCTIHEYELSYGVNIKNRFSTAVKHLIIMNY